MKTKLLFVAALFLATGSFAQEVTAKSDQATSATTQSGNAGSSGNAGISSSSNATVKTSAVDKATKKANQTKQKAKKAIATQKEAISGQTRTDLATTQKIAKENSSGSGSFYADNQIAAESKSNKVSQNASLNNKTNVSAAGVKSSGNETIKTVKIENEKVKADAKNNTDNTLKAGAGIANNAKAKPASFKMQTQLKGNARLKIK